MTIGTLELEKKNRENNGQQGTDQGFGLSFGDLTPDIASQLHVPAGVRGAIVDNVDPYTPASNVGIRRGDVVVEVNRHAITSAADASRQLQSVNSGEPAYVLLWRNGVQQFVELRKE